MKAKFINEFTRGEDPKSVLNIGKYAKVKAKLEEMYNKEGDFAYLTYKIINLNHIEVFYRPEKIEKIANVGREESLRKLKWILKYVELPKYILNERNYTYNLFQRDFNEHTLSVYETQIFFSDTPRETNIQQDKKVFDIGEYKDEAVHKMGEVIIKALNENYEPVWGFELIETIK